MLQGHPAQIFHGDKPLPLVIGDLIDGADIGMVESGGGTSFAGKTFQTLRVSCQILGKKLQRRKPAWRGVLGLVHHPHDLLVVGEKSQLPQQRRASGQKRAQFGAQSIRAIAITCRF